jgi:hypothetical protein
VRLDTNCIDSTSGMSGFSQLRCSSRRHGTTLSACRALPVTGPINAWRRVAHGGPYHINDDHNEKQRRHSLQALNFAPVSEPCSNGGCWATFNEVVTHHWMVALGTAPCALSRRVEAGGSYRIGGHVREEGDVDLRERRAGA